MYYTFDFYREEYYDEVEDLIFASYLWEHPVFGLSRFEFSHGLHPALLHLHDAWERTAGIFREGKNIVACAMNEDNDRGTVFFLFRKKRFATDEALLHEMIFFARTTMSCVDDGQQIRRFVQIVIPEWNTVLRDLCLAEGFAETGRSKRLCIRHFDGTMQDVVLPEGYRIADGTETPPFFLANVHMAAFNYSIHREPDCAKAFADMRKEKHYNPLLDLCVLDAQNRPVAMANVWYDERMPYCELEPLGVAFWERRRGLATALLAEAQNRVQNRFPNCRGMLGGDSPFYKALDFRLRESVPEYRLEMDISPSRDGHLRG